MGVGAKRVAGENASGIGAGAVGSSFFSAGDAGNMAEDGGAGGGGVLEVGEHKRARLAAGHLKHVLLVFEGDLDTCDRGVISNKLQSLKRLLMKRHDSARVVPQHMEEDCEQAAAAAQLMLRIHLLTISGSPRPLPMERLWVMLAEPLGPDAQQRLRSGVCVCVCVCVCVVCMYVSYVCVRLHLCVYIYSLTPLVHRNYPSLCLRGGPSIAGVTRALRSLEFHGRRRRG